MPNLIGDAVAAVTAARWVAVAAAPHLTYSYEDPAGRRRTMVCASPAARAAFTDAAAGLEVQVWDARRLPDRERFGRVVDLQLVDSLLLAGAAAQTLPRSLSEALAAYGVAGVDEPTVALLALRPLLAQQAAAAGMSATVAAEVAAQPTVMALGASGLPLVVDDPDDPVDVAGCQWAGWSAYVAARQRAGRDQATRLASLTGGGQTALGFDGDDAALQPMVDPDDPAALRQLLNRWAAVEVDAYMRRWHGRPGPLTAAERLDGDTLRMVGGPVADALAGWLAARRFVAAYGTPLLTAAEPDGPVVRLRSTFEQARTPTGRLIATSPNVLALPAEVNPFVRAPRGRLLVAVDASQVELRLLAHLSEDRALAGALAGDVHARTASACYGVDVARMAAADRCDRSELDRLAAAAKVDREGGRDVVVGRLQAHARRLRGVGKAGNYRIAYGGGAEGLARSLTAQGQQTSVDEAQRILDAFASAYPDASAWLRDRDRQVVAAAADAAASLDPHLTLPVGGTPPPVMPNGDGQPWQLVSRTEAGRRRLFELPTAEWWEALAAQLPSALRTAGWAELWSAQQRSSHGERLLQAACRTVLTRRQRAYRNHPLQGGVADAMTAVYGQLAGLQRRWPTAAAVLAVHDSVVVECDAADAPAVRQWLAGTMAAAFDAVCPTVPVPVDTHVSRSLAGAAS